MPLNGLKASAPAWPPPGTEYTDMITSLTSPASTTPLGLNETRAIPQRMHAIEYGDSLPAVAEQYQVTPEALHACNPQVLNPHVLYPGDVLNLPPEAVDLQAVSRESSTQTCGKDTFYDKIVRLVELREYLAGAASQSPTLAKILEQALRDGTSITVLPDCEYGLRFPGTAGITFSDGRIYVPESAIKEGTGALEHELVHAILFKHGELFDRNLPVDQRIEMARELFGGMGLDPEDGARLVREFERNGQDHHVQTRVLGVDMARERAGLPPLTPAERDALYAAVSNREAALDVQRWIADEIGKGRDPSEVYAEAEAKWAKTGIGSEHPPGGRTAQERQQSLDAILNQYADEAPILAFER